jgi:hypothetical protein
VKRTPKLFQKFMSDRESVYAKPTNEHFNLSDIEVADMKEKQKRMELGARLNNQKKKGPTAVEIENMKQNCFRLVEEVKKRNQSKDRADIA